MLFSDFNNVEITDYIIDLFIQDQAITIQILTQISCFWTLEYEYWSPTTIKYPIDGSATTYSMFDGSCWILNNYSP